MEYFKTPEPALDSGKPMPEPRRTNIGLLPTGMSERFYLENLMSRFDAGWNETAMFADVKGIRVPVSRLLFMKNDGKTTKINKRSREQFIPLIAEGLKFPDEIWLEMDADVHKVKRSYLAKFELRKGDVLQTLIVYRKSMDGTAWEEVTAFATFQRGYLERQRSGERNILIYYRK
jgi:hypothetical protein